jgi:3,4-dihydroxy 2-butanone 4-phosphate synthase / GTP cyclohydrolase II
MTGTAQPQNTQPSDRQSQDGVPLDAVERAVADIAAGRPVIVVDDADRENEGDIIFAATKATPELLGFMIRYTSGVICVPMPGPDLDRLQIPLMTNQNNERMRTAFTVSVDARDGVTTGISAADRARTVRVLVDSATEPYELVRPGHIFPLRYTDGGVLRRPGHTEAAVDLARLAGLPEAGVLAEVVNDDGSMARLPALRRFADEHGLALISISQIIEYRRHTESMVRRVAQTRLPNAYGEWQAYGYLNSVDGTEHVALVLGDLGDGEDLLTRVHSECLTGDVFGSRRCDCGAQLAAAMTTIAAEGRGAVLYLRGHEGRGIGLLSKLQAYNLQDAGADTVDANLELGLPADAREYSTGAQILTDLGVRSIRLLTNNPAKIRGLTGFGLDVAGRVPLPVLVTEENRRYLTAKRDRLGHQIDDLFLMNGSAPATDGPQAEAQ